MTRAKVITPGLSRDNWFDWLINDLLRREAKNLILARRGKPRSDLG